MEKGETQVHRPTAISLLQIHLKSVTLSSDTQTLGDISFNGVHFHSWNSTDGEAGSDPGGG